MLGQLKTVIRDQLGVPPWLALVVVGCLAHVAATALLRKPLTSPWGLIAPLAVGVALESYEIWRHYRGVGLLAPGNDPLLTILGRHALDVVLVLAGPLLVVALGVMIERSA